MSLGGLAVRHLLDIFVNDIGYDAIQEKVVKPLEVCASPHITAALIVRPRFQGVFDDYEHPVTLDKLMKTLGATVVDFPLKAQCCGGHMTQISEPVAMDMINRLLKNAEIIKADVSSSPYAPCASSTWMLTRRASTNSSIRQIITCPYFTLPN
jgi:heterodisulfide reductase subunit B2